MAEHFDKNYSKYYDLFNKNKDYGQECDFLEEVFKKYSDIPIKTILDLACGTGLHTKELISRGYELTGLDLSEEMIKIARERNPKTNFIVGDMKKFKINKKFDACICMFSSLGYLTENRQIEGYLKSIKEHLNPRGLLVLDVWNGLGVMRDLPISREKIVEVDGLKIIRKSFPDLNAKDHVNNVQFDVKVFRNGKLIDDYKENHKVRFFFPLELKKYLEDAGFELVKICPSYLIDSELTENNWNMILVAKLLKQKNYN